MIRSNMKQYKDIPKESLISQKTLEIVKSITMAKQQTDTVQQQSANQRITQQTNYLQKWSKSGKVMKNSEKFWKYRHFVDFMATYHWHAASTTLPLTIDG